MPERDGDSVLLERLANANWQGTPLFPQEHRELFRRIAERLIADEQALARRAVTAAVCATYEACWKAEGFREEPWDWSVPTDSIIEEAMVGYEKDRMASYDKSALIRRRQSASEGK